MKFMPKSVDSQNLDMLSYDSKLSVTRKSKIRVIGFFKKRMMRGIRRLIRRDTQTPTDHINKVVDLRDLQDLLPMDCHHSR